MGVFKDYEKAVWDVEHNNCTLGELEAAEQRLKDSIVEWHPYPKEKPTEERYYLVTALRGGEHQVCTAWWIDETYRFGVFTDRVEAWAELPKPYEEGADNGQHQL